MNNAAEEKLRINQKMIGQTVYVIEKDYHNWYGEVISCPDAETFIVKESRSGEEKPVNIFDIRGCR
jgi:hypothetical protein